MRTINDEAFGKLTYNNQWERPFQVSLWGSPRNLWLIVESETDEDESVSRIQRSAYEDFLARHEVVEHKMLTKLVQFSREELGVGDCTEDNFLQHSEPSSLFFPLSGEWAILFESDYDEEEGLAAVVRDGQIEVGPQDIIL